ncbi:hypothetical protein NE237_024160 [Protea cynaroides]|uniref:Uncharacterized protein n=1 Tax=Protea cynaroides TaxID=273540 RepID=A0A9Q0HCU7_9MAGN|nr:hypothetical protein NE237_024160 [Protea cynaroides]
METATTTGAQDSQSKIFLSRSSSTPELSFSDLIESSVLPSNALNRQLSTTSFPEVAGFLLYRQLSSSSVQSYTSLSELSPTRPFRRSNSESGCGCLEFVKQKITDMFERFFGGESEQNKCGLGFSFKGGRIFIREEFPCG